MYCSRIFEFGVREIFVYVNTYHIVNSSGVATANIAKTIVIPSLLTVLPSMNCYINPIVDQAREIFLQMRLQLGASTSHTVLLVKAGMTCAGSPERRA